MANKKVSEENEDLKTQLESANSKIADLNKELAALNEASVTRQQEKNDLEVELQAANEIIAGLKKTIIAESVKPSSQKETFEHGGKKYQILYGAFIPGKGKRTPLEIAADTEAQALLIANRSGVIKQTE